jgi:MFS family permease
VLTRYRAAFAPAGAASFSGAGFISRFSIAIYPIAIVLIVSGSTGSYGFAGLVSGFFVLGEALGNPVAGRLVDRLGQGRVLKPFVVLHALSVLGFLLLLSLPASRWTLLPLATAMGASLLNIGALIRARWSTVWADDPAQRTIAYSVESTLDELIFVIGPIVASVLATHAHPVFTLGLALLLVALGTLWLAELRETEPRVSVRAHGETRVFALRYRGMLLLTLAMTSMGAVFGSADVAMVAFTGEHGARGAAGLVLAALAGGSGVAALCYGGRQWRASLLRRFLTSACVLGLLPWLFFLATSVPGLAAIGVVVGFGVAPTLIGGFGLIDSLVPARSLTEGLTWMGTGLSVGYGLGSAVVGSVADAHGARIAFAIPVTCAAAVVACALLLGRRLAGRLPTAADVPASGPSGKIVHLDASDVPAGGPSGKIVHLDASEVRMPISEG